MTEPPYPNFQKLVTQIDAQMQRLGWTEAQGREHLERFYGVRSRLLLSEEELDNFLLYLQLTDTPTPNA
ncbi:MULTISPECIES: hypothetical protein [unclassified Nostoc]|uniref:hypothetical protein n=1 Tax=unclassified Nostoc TaxID=2593658 RepID=UPI002AD3F490|nr:hypothetical protein [Nostoc sp. DedQUE03]MDZ7974034.1 hypothetical protein [Nostoc sp. DedQUE03]MDZ8048535.1 hypothetical protein [Nostoc sp. DedQUE02]